MVFSFHKRITCPVFLAGAQWENIICSNVLSVRLHKAGRVMRFGNAFRMNPDRIKFVYSGD